MNPRLTLALSIAGNLALLGALALSILAHPHASTDLVASATGINDARPGGADPASRVDPAPIQKSLDWTESMHLFREAGVPAPILAQLVAEKVAQKWTPRERQIEQQHLDGTLDQRHIGDLHDERASELQQELRAALGDAFDAWEREHLVDSMYLGGPTPTEEQRDQLYTLQRHHLQQLRELERARRWGEISETEYTAAHAAIGSDHHEKLGAIIGHDRADDPELPQSPLARVQREFSALALSESQVAELAVAHERWNNLRGALAESLRKTGELDISYVSDSEAIDHTRDEEFRRIIGSEAFDAWQMVRDDRFGALQRHAARWQLEPQQVEHVYRAIRDCDRTIASLEQQTNARLHVGDAVDWSSLSLTFERFTRQTEEKLRAYLGAERFEQMQRDGLISLRRGRAIPRHSTSP